MVGDAKCGCHCPASINTETLGSDSLISVLNSLVTELTVETELLSSTRRKKESAKDDRPSAQFVGYLGIALIATFFISIVALDIGALYNDVLTLISNISNN